MIGDEDQAFPSSIFFQHTVQTDHIYLAEAAFEQEMKDGSSRGEAARSVAKLSGWSRREIYKLGLEE